MIQLAHHLFSLGITLHVDLFVDFVRKTLLNWISSGAISLLEHVGQVSPPHLV